MTDQSIQGEALRAAAIQLNSTADRTRDSETAGRLVHAFDLVAGSIATRGAPTYRGTNACVHVGPDGKDRAIHRKAHMFGPEVAGRTSRHRTKVIA